MNKDCAIVTQDQLGLLQNLTLSQNPVQLKVVKLVFPHNCGLETFKALGAFNFELQKNEDEGHELAASVVNLFEKKLLDPAC